MTDAPYIFADMPANLAIPLNAEERAFLQEYIVDLDIERAVAHSGVYKGKAPKPTNFIACGKRILNRDHVRAALHWLQSYRARHTEINAEAVLRRLWAIVMADATEISAVRVFSCRHCHGIDFQWQWINEFEFNFKSKDFPHLNDDGGYGYDPETRPHKDCPHCKGLGEQAVFLSDTRDYSPDAKALYRGAKQTRHGIEVLTHDSMRAMDMIAKILGLYGDGDRDDGTIRVIVEGGLPD